MSYFIVNKETGDIFYEAVNLGDALDNCPMSASYIVLNEAELLAFDARMGFGFSD